MSVDTSLAELLCSALAQACHRAPASVCPETTMLDLDMDSLTLVSVLARVEAVFEVELAPDDAAALLDAASVAELIERLEPLVEPR